MDINDWQAGKTQLLANQVQWPGYRSLSLLRQDKPSPVKTFEEALELRIHRHQPKSLILLFQNETNLEELQTIFEEKHLIVKNELIFLDNDYLIGSAAAIAFNFKVNGPAISAKEEFGSRIQDHVQALICQSTPFEMDEWLKRTQNKTWPTNDMKEFAKTNGCFLVGVGNKQSKSTFSEEFRVCTSFAERKFFFSMNIVQIRCLIVLKMLMKTYFNHDFKPMKSFFCKTALLYTIEETENTNWTQDNLLECVLLCLAWLENGLRKNYMPHYFMPSLDMLENRFESEMRMFMADLLSDIIKDPISAILKIEIDTVGSRLHKALNEQCTNIVNEVENPETTIYKVGKFLLDAYLRYCRYLVNDTVRDRIQTVKTTEEAISTFQECIELCDNLDKKEYRLSFKRFLPYLRSHVGSALAGKEIENKIELSDQTLAHLKFGMSSDVTCGSLRYASTLYSVEKYHETCQILETTRNRYNKDNIAVICGCQKVKMKDFPHAFCQNWKEMLTKETVEQFTSFCVVFVHTDIHIIPDAFRTLLRPSVGPAQDMVSVDGLPFLLALLFLTYRKLNNNEAASEVLTSLNEMVETCYLYHYYLACTLNDICNCIQQSK